MKSTKNLRLRLRVLEISLLLTLCALTSAAVSTHQLLLDAANHPTSAFDLGTTNITGVLNAARLPAGVPLLGAGGSLTIGGAFSSDGGSVHTGGDGSLAASGLYVGNGSFQVDGVGDLSMAGDVSLSGSFSSDAGGFASDGGGNVSAASLQVQDVEASTFSSSVSGFGIDANGDIGAPGTLSTDFGLLTTDGNGELGAQGLSVVGNLNAGLGFGVWGAYGPYSQPAAIVNATGGTTVDTQARAELTAINAVLKIYGFTAN